MFDGIFDRFFSQRTALAHQDRLLVALSGGPDSTALLTALAHWATRRDIELHAAHLDHSQDPGSADRARQAQRIATALGVECCVETRQIATSAETRRGWEAAARQVRYAFLEEQRQHTGSRYTVTGHHRDDQAETVLLRLLAGSGVAGLAGIRDGADSGSPAAKELRHVARPLLEVPRAELHKVLDRVPEAPNDDPTNRDLARPRNRLRHRLMPRLQAIEPTLPTRLASLAAAAGSAARRLDRRLLPLLQPRPLTSALGTSVRLSDLRRVPPPLLPAALALLHRSAGARYPAPAAARRELAAQLAAGGTIGCDAGEGWRWERRGDRLCTVAASRAISAPFTYTLEVPGRLEMVDLSLRFRLRPARLEPWMLRGESHRAGLALPLAPGEAVTVRSRRAGDRLQPLGAPGRRRLKEVLIDRRVPRDQRDRLPLLCLGRDGERIAWVPGITVDEAFRLTPAQSSPVWLAELEPLDTDRTEAETT